jgi:hypothetical protein
MSLVDRDLGQIIKRRRRRKMYWGSGLIWKVESQVDRT